VSAGPQAPRDITHLLRAWSSGDPAALEQLVPLVDAELRRMAKRWLRKEHANPSLQTTALLNEAYLRLIGQRRTNFHDRAHFFGVSAQIMRHLLVDHARARRSAKRGGGLRQVPFEDALAVAADPDSDLVAIDEALDALSRNDPRKGRVVELRFYGGLTVDETAEVLALSPETVHRDWRLAKLWLLRELSGGGPHVPGTTAPD
jgi:RNA polymerase sigma factor (TIGR02999 family)